MRCDCCNKKLTDYETSLKSVSSDEYLNTCTGCLIGLGISVKGNGTLINKHDIDIDDVSDDDMLDFGWEEFVPRRNAISDEE